MLRQRLSTAVMALALSGSLALGMMANIPVVAHAERGASQFCKEEIRPFLEGVFELTISQGACVSALQAGNFTAAAGSICKDVFEEVNHGKCQKEVKEFLEDLFD